MAANDVDLQRLLISLEASFVKYDRAWVKAIGTTDANVKRTQKQFDGLAKVVTNGSGNAAKGMGAMSVQTSNIAAQFQDIAVQLQAGQSPFTIALQQGTQLSAALGTGRGLRGTVAALGSAFGSLVSPVSLATIALITAGGIAVQYFGTLLNDGKVSEKTLKEQADLIRKLADRWGDAAPALKAYVDQLDKADVAAQGKEAEAALIAAAWQGARDAVSGFSSFVTDAIAQLQAAGAEAGVIDELQRAWLDVSKGVKDGKASMEDINRVSAALSNAIETVQLPGLRNLQSSWLLVAQAIQTASDKAAGFTGVGSEVNRGAQATAAFIAEQERLNRLTEKQLALEAEISRVKADAERAGANLSDETALQLAQARLDREERIAQTKAGAKTSAKAETEAQREAKAVLELIEALEFEYDLLGLTNQEREVANALRRAGSAATAEQRAEIEDWVNKTYEQREAIAALNDLYAEFGQAGKTAVMGIVDALRDGKIEASELGDILSNVLGQFGQFFLNQAFGSFGGGGGGNILSTIFGGKRAAGGPVDAGKAYLVGEKGPEIIVPGRSGTVVPNHQLGGGGLSISIDARGAQMGVAEQIEARLRHWSRFEAPPLIRHHARTTMPENG